MPTCVFDSCHFDDLRACPEEECWVARWPAQQIEDVRQIREMRRVPVGAVVEVPVESGFYVYRHLDDEGRVLYVGRTNSPATRTANHIAKQNSTSRWWPLVVRVEWERFEFAHVAAVRESRLIEELMPLHNIAGTGRRSRLRPRRKRPTPAELERTHRQDPFILDDLRRLLATRGDSLRAFIHALEVA